MKKYLALVLLLLSTHIFAQSYICKQAGYINGKGKYVTNTKEDIFLTLVPETSKSITITRIDQDSSVPMLFTLTEIKKNTTEIPGDSIVLMRSKTLDEPVRARLIGPNKEDDSVSSVVDLVTESFLKEHRTYEERYFCIRESKKLEKI